ncbi:hypothetical protein ACKRLN_01955 [Anaerococcus sp. DFU013_CI05]|uniref:hypothetical protein n=1 Tax=Anaerococcus sp. AH8042_DFU013_CI05 TaxID=3385202 RepID=UPI003A52228C
MDNNFSLAEYNDLVEQGYDREEFVEYFITQSISLVGWKDHLAEFADVRAEKDVGKDSEGNPLYQHIRFDGVVVQEGTPVNAENLGQMEWNDLINFVIGKYVMDKIREVQVQVATLIGQNNNNMPYNSFVANAKNIGEDIEMVEGIYDEVNGRGVV